MEILLNRWRGTGDIFNISKFIVTGTDIYMLYFGVLFGLVTQNWYVGILASLGFRIGESFGWGKWVGALTSDGVIDLEKAYLDKEGYHFPYIHYIANIIVKEREDFIGYCRVALGLRGVVWAMFIYIGLVFGNEIVNSFLDFISLIGINIEHINAIQIGWFDYFVVVLIYGIGFPLACYLSTIKSFNYKNKFISIVGEWETQEIYYGAIHCLCNMYLVYTIIY